MPSKKNKSRKILQRIIFYCLISFLGGFYIEQAIAGSAFSQQGNAVYRGLIEELIHQKICSDNLSCSTKLNLYRTDGKRIYFNMYGQNDMTLTTNVTIFLIKKGLTLSNGMPITLTVFPKQKEEYVNSNSFFNKEEKILTLELK